MGLNLSADWETSLSPQDFQVVAGIRNAQADGSLDQIIGSLDIETSPEELRPYLQNPLSIKTMDIYEQYERFKRQVVLDKLLAKSR